MVKSMTGYGRARETLNGRDITVEVRVVAAEALGWYNLSCRRLEIVEGLKAISTSDADLAKEIKQTLNRLK